MHLLSNLMKGKYVALKITAEDRKERQKLIRARSTRMWANAQPDGRPAEHRWRPLFNAAKFG